MMTEVGAAFSTTPRPRRCATTCSRAASCGPTTSGASTRGSWAEQIAQGAAAGEYPIGDLPLEHPLFRTQFEVAGVPQIPSIGYWFGSGGGTSERGADSAVPHARGIVDKHGRIMVLMTHNTDFGDSWEEEATTRSTSTRCR